MTERMRGNTRVPDTVDKVLVGQTLRDITKLTADADKFYDAHCEESPRGFFELDGDGEVLSPMTGEKSTAFMALKRSLDAGEDVCKKLRDASSMLYHNARNRRGIEIYKEGRNALERLREDLQVVQELYAKDISA